MPLAAPVRPAGAGGVLETVSETGADSETGAGAESDTVSPFMSGSDEASPTEAVDAVSDEGGVSVSLSAGVAIVIDGAAVPRLRRLLGGKRDGGPQIRIGGLHAAGVVVLDEVGREIRRGDVMGRVK